jgi:hypothetical protein
MNTGIEILLKRIQDCPDDFQYNLNTDTSTRWNKLLMEALRSDVITEEEKSALKHEVTEMGRARFTERVMQALAGVDETSEDPKSLEDVIKQYRATGISSVGQTQLSSTVQSPYSNTIGTMGTVTLPSGSITLGKTTLEEEQLKQMKAHLDAHREAMNKVEVKKKPLIKRIFK